MFRPRALYIDHAVSRLDPLQDKGVTAMGDEAGSERRRSYRFDSLNLLSYTAVTADGTPLTHGMARTLNVSEGGILVETHESFEAGQTLLFDIAFEDELVQVQGRVAHATSSATEGRYSIGVQFLEIDDGSRSVLDGFLKACETQQT